MKSKCIIAINIVLLWICVIFIFWDGERVQTVSNHHDARISKLGKCISTRSMGDVVKHARVK